MPTPKRGTRSLSSLATRRVTSDRSFGSSTSFAKCRRSVETVGHPRCQMQLLRTQTIPNDKLPASGAYGRAQPKRTLINARLVPCPPDRSRNHFCETNPIGHSRVHRARASGPAVAEDAQAGIMTSQPPGIRGMSVQSRLGRDDQIGKTAAIVRPQDEADADQFGDGGPVPLDTPSRRLIRRSRAQ